MVVNLRIFGRDDGRIKAFEMCCSRKLLKLEMTMISKISRKKNDVKKLLKR